MARFDTPQDPLFRRINTSVGFDRRLWPQDVRGSMAHARALERAGVLDEDELTALIGRPRAAWPESWSATSSRSPPTTRTSTWRSSGG